MRPLVIIGSGGFGRETLDAVRDINDQGATWDVLGFVDDDPALFGQQIGGIPVLGGRDRLPDYPDAQLVVTIGNPNDFSVRPRVVAQLGLPPGRYATLVHPTSSVSRSSSVGPGTVILAGVVATSAVRIGSHVAIMPGVVLTHDDVIEDFATLASGVHLAGRVRVGAGAYLGAGSQVRENLNIGPGSLIGMGAGVTVDVPAGQVWAGLPARYFRPVHIDCEEQIR
jgi:sugar O-acyltransferase (sialic acid O-acetyltransferase NeuD family)